MNHHPARSHPGAASSTLHYPAVPPTTAAFWLAVFVALSLHALFLFCLNGHPFRLPVVPSKSKIVEWTLPPIPEDPPVAKPTELPDAAPAVHVPSLLDVPQPVVIDTAFRQLAEPLQPLTLDSQAALTSIPVSYQREPANGGNGGDIFDISTLERAPVPVARISPDYPFELKRTGIEGSVRIRFVVDTSGRVILPEIVSSTDRGFEQAALTALAKWKFRPGMKNGVKVKTRMEQQIDFTMQQ